MEETRDCWQHRTMHVWASDAVANGDTPRPSGVPLKAVVAPFAPTTSLGLRRHRAPRGSAHLRSAVACWVLASAAACSSSPPRPAAVEPDPAMLQGLDYEHGTRGQPGPGMRFVAPAKAGVAAPPASVLTSAYVPCAPVPEAAPPARFEPETRTFDDAVVQEAFDRERMALERGVAIRCHVYVGAPERALQQTHLEVQAGELTQQVLGDLTVALAFYASHYDGSHFSAEVREGRRSLLQYARGLSLAAPPPTLGCDGPGFTGWVRGESAQSVPVQLFCEVVTREDRDHAHACAPRADCYAGGDTGWKPDPAQTERSRARAQNVR